MVQSGPRLCRKAHTAAQGRYIQGQPRAGGEGDLGVGVTWHHSGHMGVWSGVPESPSLGQDTPELSLSAPVQPAVLTWSVCSRLPLPAADRTSQGWGHMLLSTCCGFAPPLGSPRAHLEATLSHCGFCPVAQETTWQTAVPRASEGRGGCAGLVTTSTPA